MRNPEIDPVVPPPQTLDQLLEMNPQNMSDEQLRAYVDRLGVVRRKDLRQLIKDESLGRPEHQGFIYILSNRAMPGLLKIGTTCGPVEKRAAEMATTGVPEPFTKEKAFPVYADPKEVEKRIHGVLDLFRTSKKREFFRLPIENAVAIVEAVLDREFGVM